VPDSTTTEPEPTTTTDPPTTSTTEMCSAGPDAAPAAAPNPMEREILDTRPPPANPPKDCRFTSLIASGDSVTSSHNQEKSGVPGPNKCPGTVKNGNDDRFSYAYRTFSDMDRFKGGDYYDFARTGFGTVEMYGPNKDDKLDPKTKDTCDNAWGDTIRHPDNRGISPSGLVLRAIDYEKSKGKDPVWVSTGGVNNTNWVSMLKGYAACHVLRLMFSNAPGQTMTIRGEALQARYDSNDAAKKKHDDELEVQLITKGGKCQFTQNLGLKTLDSGKIDVPQFDVPRGRWRVWVPIWARTSSSWSRRACSPGSSRSCGWATTTCRTPRSTRSGCCSTTAWTRSSCPTCERCRSSRRPALRTRCASTSTS
jgi:hypothetical protein